MSKVPDKQGTKKTSPPGGSPTGAPAPSLEGEDAARKKLKENEENLRNAQVAGDSDTESVEVESVQGRRVKNGKTYYLIRWKEDNVPTWEEADTLGPIRDLIEIFEKEQEQKSRKGQDSGRGKVGLQKPSRRREEQKSEMKSPRGEGHRRRRETKAVTSKMRGAVLAPGSEQKTAMNDEGFFHTIHGHFVYGDVPHKIIFSRAERRRSSEQVYVFIVSWKRRSDGNRPTETEFTNKELMTLDPDLLITFYESKMHIRIDEFDDDDYILKRPGQSTIFQSGKQSSARGGGAGGRDILGGGGAPPTFKVELK